MKKKLRLKRRMLSVAAAFERCASPSLFRYDRLCGIARGGGGGAVHDEIDIVPFLVA